MRLYLIIALTLCCVATRADGFIIQDTSVQHFAHHGLCSHGPGRYKFYLAVKQKMCKISESFVAQLVIDMCRQGYHNDKQLLKWVREIFDTNGDEKISNFEKHNFNNGDKDDDEKNC